ncbi:MAG: DUF1501 domain-containing protein, partial [Planctomycetes bacterium]|nr:DUF1501 domain-containing protein [Planctomycetota bacterium]
MFDQKQIPLCSGFEPTAYLSRRDVLARFGMGLGGMALAELINPVTADAEPKSTGGVLKKLHHTGKAKRVIFLFQAGGPSQMDLFDYKPLLNKLHGTQLPDSVRKGQRLTSMSGNQSSLPLVGSPFKFRQQGKCGAWFSNLLPHTAKIADELCFIKTMHSEAINHGPAVTHMQTGSQFPGRPSMGAWLDYGLGTENEDLPAFVVLVTKNKGGQPLVSRFWGSGFLPSKYQGVRFRSGKDPVLYLSNPNGIDAGSRRRMLDTLKQLHELQLQKSVNPQIETRIAQYELAFRMQRSIPEVTDLSQEPKHVLDGYGKDVRNPGSFAANCLLARRLAERGVRFIQLYHQGWDHHGGLPGALPRQCRETDQPAAALVRDLKRRGLLDETLVIWGGEFGRTPFLQGKIADKKNWGRDHHPYAFTLWMAGGGIKAGTTYGASDEFG